MQGRQIAWGVGHEPTAFAMAHHLQPLATEGHRHGQRLRDADGQRDLGGLVDRQNHPVLVVNIDLEGREALARLLVLISCLDPLGGQDLEVEPGRRNPVDGERGRHHQVPTHEQINDRVLLNSAVVA